jgi:hypothetical protein
MASEQHAFSSDATLAAPVVTRASPVIIREKPSHHCSGSDSPKRNMPINACGTAAANIGVGSMRKHWLFSQLSRRITTRCSVWHVANCKGRIYNLEHTVNKKFAALLMTVASIDDVHKASDFEKRVHMNPFVTKTRQNRAIRIPITACLGSAKDIGIHYRKSADLLQSSDRQVVSWADRMKQASQLPFH